MYKHFFKRFFDFWISLIALIVLSPILLIITLWLTIANKGAGAFFTQERPGKDEKIFKVIKFKSMTDERDADGNLLPDAQRLTKVGRFVRSTSIDELPQLINVLKGDMALIGPRPLLVEYLPYYSKRESLRHTVRPGITGWAQVNGRSSICWNDKLEYDAYYVEHLSFCFDIKILCITFLNVIKKKDIEIPTGNTLVKERSRKEQKKLLILGSDFVTISVVHEAHNQGMYVIVADLMENSPTKKAADEQWLVSTTDIDLLEEKCKENKVDAIMFGASDFNITNCRKLCHRLNLPTFCEDDIVWNNVRNKRIFKTICKRVGAPIATDYICENDKIEELSESIIYPVVVKPSDKSGNRGLSFCNNHDELIRAYGDAREISEDSIIIERRLKGIEYNIHYLLADGEAKLLYFTSTNHQPGYNSNLYSFKYSTKQHLDQYIKEVDEKVKQVFKELSCKNGIVWVDAIRDADDRFYLLEMGHRFGGVMTYIPYEKVSNFNSIKWMLDIACGINHTPEQLPNIDLHSNSIAASYHLFTTHDGIIGEIKGLDYLSTIDGIYIDMPKRVGASVRGNACIGLIGVYGKDYNDICCKIDIINSNLDIIDSNGHDLIIKYDDYENIK